ncbi:hypothetical protein BDW_06720 [Bdellovibrio bacteriovorus W]|nr:hypothetical protein BDW_06720 [Bdellovibrio bacteriovorus W]
MKLKAILAGALVFSMFGATNALARGTANGVLATLSGTITKHTVKVEGQPESKEDTLLGDIKIGYLNGNGLYLGGLYGFGNVSNDDGVGNSGDSKVTTYGASIGYVGATGFYLTGHYLFASKFDDLEEGNGFQIDFGHLSNVTSTFVVGVQVSYKSMEYKVQDIGTKVKTTDLFPMLTLGFLF